MAETPPPTTPPAKKHSAFDDLEHRVEEARAQFDEARAQFDEANAKINARTGRNLFAAIGIGLVLGGLFLVSLILLKWLFMILAGALIGLTVFELASRET